jgi:anaphase-promoting complex subunit 4
MFCYNDLGYQNLRLEGYVNGPSREDLVHRALQLWNEEQVCTMQRCILIDILPTNGRLLICALCILQAPPADIPIKRCRELIVGKEGDVSLAVNGRTGRRVACVLDTKGSTMEILDMEGSSEEMESEGDDGGT